jgi:hypothetical protein
MRGQRAVRRRKHASGAILLEVVLAITLFVTAALVVLGAMNTSFDVTSKLELKAHAVDRAVTILSLLQTEMIDLNDPDAAGGLFEPPFDDWSYELAADEPLDTLDGPVMQSITVTVTHEPDGYSYSLTQLFSVPAEDDLDVVDGDGP